MISNEQVPEMNASSTHNSSRDSLFPNFSKIAMKRVAFRLLEVAFVVSLACQSYIEDSFDGYILLVAWISVMPIHTWMLAKIQHQHIMSDCNKYVRNLTGDHYYAVDSQGQPASSYFKQPRDPRLMVEVE